MFFISLISKVVYSSLSCSGFFPPLVTACIPQSGVCEAVVHPRRSKHAVHPCTAILTLPKAPSLLCWNFGSVRLQFLGAHTNLSFCQSLPLCSDGEARKELGAPVTWQSRKEDSEQGDEIPVWECMKDPPSRRKEVIEAPRPFWHQPKRMCTGHGELSAGIPRLSLSEGEGSVTH